MAEGDKPYRRYRGGRTKGRVPLDRGKRPAAKPARKPGRPGRRRWGRWVTLALVGLLLLTLVWGLLGYVSFSSGVGDANDRLPRRAHNRLAEDDGSIFSSPTTILVIGTDGGRAPGRQDARRSDSLLLLRTDPGKHRLSYLSIPRDLRVDIPGYGSAKINAANQVGGPALTIATVRNLTGIPINHVVVFDFDGFRELIDAMGGVEIDVPRRDPVERVRLPVQAGAVRELGRLAVREGEAEHGRAAARSSTRGSARTSSTRRTATSPAAARQQAVADAVGDKIASFGTFLRLPFVGDSLAAPLVTDLSAWELMQLGWVRFRADASRALHCRLGGEPRRSAASR